MRFPEHGDEGRYAAIIAAAHPGESREPDAEVRALGSGFRRNERQDAGVDR